MEKRVVILGGSFGGLTTAYELRRMLGPDSCSICVISPTTRFTFIPSLPWLAMGSRTPEQISFDLRGPLNRKGITFINEAALRIDPESRVVVTDRGEQPYDYLVIATGHRSANETVDGLGPFDGPGHSLMSLAEAEELRLAVGDLLVDPGPVVVGCAPGASCIGPAYEFAFELDYLLRRRFIRHLVPITFVTPEPYLGHMGMGGAGKIRQLLEGEMQERDISYHVSATVSHITSESVKTLDHGEMKSVLSLIIPPLGGVEAVSSSQGLANPKGFIPVNSHYRHERFEDIYGVGVAVALPPVEETLVPVNFPKTGQMTEQMAMIAANDIASRINKSPSKVSQPLSASCVLDMGNTGIYLSVNPVRPPRNKIPSLHEGRQWIVAKRLFEKAYLWHAKRGRRVPTAIGW